MTEGKKKKSTIMVPELTYKETRILAIRLGVEISKLVDEALQDKINKEYAKMGIPSPILMEQSQPQSQSQIDRIELSLPGIEFPINKAEIIKLAEKANRSDKSNYVKHISEGKYNKLQLKNELGRISNGIEWIINTEPLRKEQYKEKKLEQERQITK